jgi:hypothetical protein
MVDLAEIGWGGVTWMGQADGGGWCRAAVNTAENIRVPQRAGMQNRPPLETP